MKKGSKLFVVFLLLLSFLTGCSSTPELSYSNVVHTARNLSELEILAEPEGSENEEPLSKAPQEALQGMTQVAASDDLVLYVDLDYTFIAVQNCKSGKLWFSNPPDYQRDEIAQSGIIERTLSQLFITYIANDGKQATMNNYYDSIMRNQFVIRKIPNGVRIDYIIGEVTRSAAEIPKRISIEMFEKAFINNDKLDDKEKREVEKQYILNEAETEYEWVVSESEVYIERLLNVIDKCGYTKEQLDLDKTEKIENESTQFTVPVEYTLKNGLFYAEIPLQEIKSATTEQIVRIDFLENFGSAFMTDEGYAFVPDGPGALMHYDQKAISPRVYLPVYGEDNTIDKEVKETGVQNVRLPVFGAKNGNDAFVATIIDGEAFAEINVQKAGYDSSYHTVSSSYQLLYNDFTKLANGSMQSQISVIQRQSYGGSICVKYQFLTGEDADYAGMAASIRNDLMEEYQLKPLDKGEVPFFLETLGAVRMYKNTMGINHIGLGALTTFSQTQQISQELKQKGVTNQKIRLLGWMDGGMEQDLAKQAKPLGELGGKSDFKALIQYAEKEGFSLYPNVEFLTASSKGYSTYKYSAKTLDARFAKEYRYDVVTQEKKEKSDDIDVLFRNIISVSVLDQIRGSFTKSYDKFGLQSLSLGDMGEKVYADYRRSNNIDRQEAAQQISLQTEKLKNSYLDLMASGGNFNILGYVKSLVNTPSSSSSYLVLDETVPFFQIVIHGLIDYTLQPINLSSLSTSTLKALEYGACPYYTLSFESSTKLKNTAFDFYSSINYKDWLDYACADYQTASPILSEVRNQFITDHQKLAEGIYKTTYEGGQELIVNYNDKDFIYQNQTVQKKSFLFKTADSCG